MTKFRMTALMIAAAFVFSPPPLARAQNMSENESLDKKQFEKHLQDVYNQLQLTDEQRNRLEINKKENRAKMESFHQQMKAAKEAMRVELMKPQLDRAKVEGLNNQIKDLQSQIQDTRLNSILAVRSTLSPEQFTRFSSLMHKHKPGHE